VNGLHRGLDLVQYRFQVVGLAPLGDPAVASNSNSAMTTVDSGVSPTFDLLTCSTMAVRPWLSRDTTSIVTPPTARELCGDLRGDGLRAAAHTLRAVNPDGVGSEEAAEFFHLRIYPRVKVPAYDHFW